MCLYPALGIQIGLTEAGKPKYWRAQYMTEDYYKLLNNPDAIMMPCGVCMECRLKYSREWAVRCMLEAQYHDSNYFLTLTYDNDHLDTVRRYYCDENGEAYESLSLNPKDLQDFVKRLRRNLDYHNGDKIRHYSCGEYGSQTHRPHYHLIVFGLQLDDLVELKRSSLGFPYYTSEKIRKLWPYGNHLICNMTFETAAYVARYCTKKLNGDFEDFYKIFNIEPEFSHMSKRPGIARQYFEEHKDEIYQYDELFLRMDKGGSRNKPPGYFDHLYDIENHEKMHEIKESRKKVAEMMEKLRQANTTLSPEEQRVMRKQLMEKRLSMLVRPDI